MTQVALGLDLGTSGVRVIAVDTNGNLVTEVNRTYPLLTPQPGWTEQNPADWKNATLDALKAISEQLGNHEILALGLSGQMHGMVPLDAHGEVVRPAILWNDQRTGDAIKEMEARVPRADMIQRTGNPAITGFHAGKLIWMRNAEPDNYARTTHSLLPKDYIGYVLTGNMHAEPSDASGSNCFNLANKQWDTDILNALELPVSLFPDVIASHEVTGKLTADMAAVTGLPEGLPVIAGGGDNAAAGIGLGLSSSDLGRGSMSLGTSGVIFLPLASATPDPEGRAHLFCHADGGYHLLGVTLAAAGSFDWYHRVFAPDTAFSDLTALASTSAPGANGVTFKPYLAGERTPYMNPDLRGSWTGLSLATTQADVVRSVLEGVAFSLRDALDVMTPLAPAQELLATGGGAKSELWLQIVADVLQLPLLKPKRNQGAAYGGALLALQGVGVVASAAELAKDAPADVCQPGDASVYDSALARYRA